MLKPLLTCCRVNLTSLPGTVCCAVSGAAAAAAGGAAAADEAGAVNPYAHGAGGTSAAVRRPAPIAHMAAVVMIAAHLVMAPPTGSSAFAVHRRPLRPPVESSGQCDRQARNFS